MCALLGSDLIQIYDNMDPKFSSIFSYRRDFRSLKQHGTNHWFQWLNNDTFAFGSCPGYVLLFKSITEKKPIEFSVGSVISSTFVAYQYLGLCLYGPTITFISSSGETISTISIPSASSFVKEARVYENNTLSVFVNGLPFLTDLSKSGIENKRKFSLRKFNAEKIVSICINSHYSKISYAKSDGSVYLTGLYSTQEHMQIIPAGGEVIRLFWIYNETQLLVLKNEGVVVFWNLQNQQIYRTQISNMAYHIFSDFSDVTRTLLYLDGKSLIKINLCSLYPPICVTSSAIYSISKQAKIGIITSSAELSQCISIPIDIYPITHAIQSPDGYIAITNLSKVVTIVGNQTYCKSLPNIENIAWCKKNLAVFHSSGKSHELSFFSLNLKDEITIPCPQYANAISTSENQYIIISSGNNTFTLFEFNQKSHIEKPVNISYMMSSMEWDSLSVVTTTYSLPKKITNAVCTTKSIFILYDSGDLIDFSSLSVVDSNVQRIWDYRDLIFIQKSDVVIIKDFKSSHEFKLKPLCSSGSEFIFLEPEFKCNFFPFSSADFVFVTLQKLITDPEKCYSFAYSLTKLPNFDQFMYKLCIFSTQNALLAKFIEFLMYFKPKERANIVNTFDHHIQMLLVENHFDFSDLFHSVTDSMKSRILVASNPTSFTEIIQQESECINKLDTKILKDTLREIISNGEWSKAMRLSQTTKIDFIESLSFRPDLEKYSLAKCLENISKDNSRWTDNEQPNVLRFIGFSFIAASLNRFALSCFIALHDEQKINFLLSSDLILQEEFEEYNNITPIN